MSAEEFEALLKSSDKPVLVYYGASWCIPCKVIKPVFLKASKSTSNATFAVVDSEDGADIFIAHHITRIPVVKAFVRGIEVEQFTGSNVTHLEKMLAKYY